MTIEFRVLLTFLLLMSAFIILRVDPKKEDSSWIFHFGKKDLFYKEFDYKYRVMIRWFYIFVPLLFILFIWLIPSSKA